MNKIKSVCISLISDSFMIAPILILLAIIINLLNLDSIKWINYLLGALMIVFIIIEVCKFIFKLSKDKIFDILLIISISSFIIGLLYKSIVGQNNFLYIVEIIGIIFMEIFLLYESIKKVFTHKLIYVISYASLFIFIGSFSIYYYSIVEYDNEIIYNSLSAIFASIVGGFITLIGVALTIQNENKKSKQLLDYKEENYNKALKDIVHKYETQIKLLRKNNIPLAIFNKFDCYSEALTLPGCFPNYLMYTKNNTKNDTMLANLFSFRMIFNSSDEIKSITFNNVSIYSNLNDALNIEQFDFQTNCSDKNSDLSINQINSYQVMLNLLIPNNMKEDATRFRKCIYTSNKDNKLFFNIRYTITNELNISQDYEMKFKLYYNNQKKFSMPSELSNWKI